MTPPLFLTGAERLLGEAVVLDGAEGRHAAVVRRVRVGERIDVGDGAGLVLECVVEQVEGERVSCAVLERREVQPPQPQLYVVQALAKGGRDEDAVEAMTEVGVDVFVPWEASRSIARWKRDRWSAVAREAAKQSRRAWVPEVSPPAEANTVCDLLVGMSLAVVLHEAAEVPLVEVPMPAQGDVAVIVGPEGGITGEELAMFDSAGAKAYRLGPNVLRTSTAGVAAAAVLLARSGRWS